MCLGKKKSLAKEAEYGQVVSCLIRSSDGLLFSEFCTMSTVHYHEKSLSNSKVCLTPQLGTADPVKVILIILKKACYLLFGEAKG
jgi:hypothetical protein